MSQYTLGRPPWRGRRRVVLAVVMFVLLTPFALLMAVRFVQSVTGESRADDDAFGYAIGFVVLASFTALPAWAIADAVVRWRRHDPPWPERRSER